MSLGVTLSDEQLSVAEDESGGDVNHSILDTGYWILDAIQIIIRARVHRVSSIQYPESGGVIARRSCK